MANQDREQHLAEVLEEYDTLGEQLGLGAESDESRTSNGELPLDGPEQLHLRVRRLELGVEASLMMLKDLTGGAHLLALSTKEILTPQEAADFLRVSISSLRRWNSEGHIRSYRTPGGNHRFRREDLEGVLKLEEN